MRNAGLDEAQVGIKIAERNINNLRYADTSDTTLMAESEEKLKSLLKVKEESEKVGLKLNIQKTKIKPSGPPRWQCRRSRFNTWVGKIPWRREWLPTPVFLPGESHGQSSLAGYSPWGHKESDMTEQLTEV